MGLSLEDLRRLTRAAVAHGWLDPGAAFDVALRCAKDREEPEIALASLLSPSQVARLLRELVLGEASEDLPAPSVPQTRASTATLAGGPASQRTMIDASTKRTLVDEPSTPSRAAFLGAARLRPEEEAATPPAPQRAARPWAPNLPPAPRAEKTLLDEKKGAGPASSGRYELESILGQGGSGKVFLALDRAMRRRVALKVLRRGASARPEAVSRFLQEAQVAAQLEHPNIIPVYDWGVLPDGQPYYTMRVVLQRSLKDVLLLPAHDAEWPLAKKLGLLAQVCHAMEYVHARGVVHRDLKPSNVLLGRYGEVYLSDWGIAKSSGQLDLASGPESASSLRAGALLGTPGYAAPEQAQGGPLDGRADLYALGVILYELLCQRRPFAGESVQSVLLAQLETEPPPPEEFNPAAPPGMSQLAMRLLARHPAQRPARAEEVATTIEDFLVRLKRRVGLRRRTRHARQTAITLRQFSLQTLRDH